MKEEIETRGVAEMARSENRQADKNVAVTPEMKAAGIEAADLISYEWGSTLEGILVSRVYRAMETVRRESL